MILISFCDKYVMNFMLSKCRLRKNENDDNYNATIQKLFKDSVTIEVIYTILLGIVESLKDEAKSVNIRMKNKEIRKIQKMYDYRGEHRDLSKYLG